MSSNCIGDLYIVAAPSGGGKTSLVKHLTDSLEGILVSISHTTRSMRPGEKEGQDYFFVNEERFMELATNNQFIEYAKVFNHWYGTSVAQISERLEQGIDVVLDIDWQGARQIKLFFPRAVSIFIIPPSFEVLKQRLMNRARDNEEVIADRMAKAQAELSHYSEFDYLIINDDFEVAAAELESIVVANRLRMAQQANKHTKLLSFLLSSQ